MSLLNNPIPPKPSRFHPHEAPPGVAVNLTAFKNFDYPGQPWYQTRQSINPRLQLIHTNGAGGEGGLQSQINWANAARGNTHPHYCVNAPQPTKFVPSNRMGIGNYRVSDWSIVIETADAGYPTPGQAGGFLHDHAEIVSRIIAYESILWNIPLEYPSNWQGAGTACHTEPFGYPYWTNSLGKVCPGFTKKRQVREEILPRARQIKAAWTNNDTGDVYDMAYTAMKPTRILDSRYSGKLIAGKPLTVIANGVPQGSYAAAINVTYLENDAAGFVTIWDSGDRPTASCVNADAPWAVRNGFTITKLSGFGTFEVYTPVNAHVIVDVVGAFTP